MNDSYAHGFCKAAADAGVNPLVLAKTAERRLRKRREKKAASNSLLNSISDTYNNMDPFVRRALISGLLTGAGTYILSNPYNPNRFLNSLAGGAIGGLGTYALDRSGGTDALVDFIRDNITRVRPKRRTFFSETMHDSTRALS